MLQKYARTQKRPIIRKKCTCASLEVTNTGPNIQMFQPLSFVLRKLPKKRACFVYVYRFIYPRQEVHERKYDSKHTYRHSHIICQQGKMHRQKHFRDKSVTCDHCRQYLWLLYKSGVTSFLLVCSVSLLKYLMPFCSYSLPSSHSIKENLLLFFIGYIINICLYVHLLQQ